MSAEMETTGRRTGYEFNHSTRLEALSRAGGKCEWPEGCNNAHNQILDHVTSISLGKLLGFTREDLRSLENAQYLCQRHSFIKDAQERVFLRMIKRGLNQFQDSRPHVFWNQIHTVKLPK